MFIGIANALSKFRKTSLPYIKDNLKLYLDFKSNRSDTLAFSSEGSTSFDGNDEIKIADSNDLQLSTLTISAWIKPNGASEDGYIFSKFDDSTSGGYALNFQGSTDKIRLLSSGVTIGTSNAVFVDDNVWVHIAVTVDGSGNLVYYRNGVSAGTASSVTLNTNSVGVVIGNRTGGSSAGHYFNGSMANVAVWSRHLSPEEIQSVMNKSYSQLGSVEKTSLVMWQSLDKNTLPSLHFNSSGTKDWVQLPMPFAPSSAYTISMWIKPEGNNNYFFSARESNIGITMSLDANRKFWCTNKSDSSQGALTGTNAVPLNAWSHVAMTWDGTNLKAYLNGALDKTFSSPITMPTITTNARIGQSTLNDAYSSWDGGIKSVALYNTTAKTQDEIQAIHAQGLTGDESTNSGIFAYYKLDTASTSSGAVKDLVGTNHGTIVGDPVLEEAVVYDSTSNNNDGTPIGGVTTTTSVYGGNSPTLPRAIDIAESFAEQIGNGSASLSANGENITISSSSDFPSGSNNKSFTAWLYKENSNNEGIFNTGSAAVRQLFAIVTYSGDIRINTYGDDLTFSNSNIPINEWFHLAVVQSGRDVSVYLNGILNETKTHTGDSNLASTDLLIGDYIDNVYASWTGSIAQVGYWQEVLTQAQIQSLMESTSYAKIPADIKTNIRGYWALDADNSVPALSFDGDNDAINIPHSSDYKPTTAITVSSWYKPTDHSNWGKIINVPYRSSGWSNPWFSYALSSSQSTTGKPAFGGGFDTDSGLAYAEAASSTVLNLNEWYHLVGTFDGTNIKLYINGVLDKTTARTGTISYPEDLNTQIGGRGQYAPGEWTEGHIASVAVYSDAKDVDFILAQHNKGIDADWSSDTNLVGYWKMDNGTTVNDLSSNSNNGTVSGATLIENAVALDSTSNNNDGSLI